MSAFQLFVWYAGPIETSRYLLKNGGDPYAPSAYFGRVPLHLAIAAEHWDAVGLFLDLPGINVNTSDMFGSTPLHYLLRTKYPSTQVLQRFIDASADINRTDDLGYSPLRYACYNGHLQCAETLLTHGADVNSNGSPLHAALRNCPRTLPVLRLPVDYKVNPLLTQDRENPAFRLAITKAPWLQDVRPLNEVLQAYHEHGSDVNEQGAESVRYHPNISYPPKILVLIIGRRGPELLKALFTWGLDPNLSLHRLGNRTLLHAFASHGHSKAVKSLLDYGADVTARCLGGTTALDLAVERWPISPGTPMYAELIEIVETLIEAAQGQTRAYPEKILDMAIYSCSTVLQRALSCHDRLENKEDVHGWTPLMRACYVTCSGVVAMLASYDDSGILKDGKVEDVVLGHSLSKFENRYYPLLSEVASSGAPRDIGKFVQESCAL